MATKRGSKWTEQPIDLRYRSRQVRQVLEVHHRDRYDLYFCPNTFSRPLRRAEFGQSTRWGWCDIDAADPEKFSPKPSVLLRTSPGRYQGLWLWEKRVSATVAEGYSHTLAYRFGGDRNGWSITKYLRLPNTYNHKPHYNRPLVKILRSAIKPIVQRPALLRGDDLRRNRHERNVVLPASPHTFDYAAHDAAEVIARYKKKLRLRILALLASKRVLKRDRSRQIFMIVAGLNSAGATTDEIAACVWASPYFQDKHGKDAAKLAQEVTRILGKLNK